MHLTPLISLLLVLNLSSVCNAFRAVPLGLPPSDKNLEKVMKYYETLYLRLRAKDYGFAQFGSQCEVLTIHELEDFLDLGHLILKDQQEDGAYRRAVEEHLRPKLKYFFDRARTYCDFRKFLTCDKTHRKCSCPHSSMGVGRNGTCQVNIGKRCDFTDEKLNSLGILVLNKQRSNITCIGKAECVTSFGAATKICKCRSGYWGSNCRASRYGSSNSVFAGDPFDQTTMMGRGFWVPDDHDDHQEYFLYPEEIQEEIVKMMNLREMFEPDEREKEAEILYSKMETDIDKEEMVTMDIFIRRLARLNYGEACDPKKQTIIENPPLAKEKSTWVDPKPVEILKWQESILKDGQPLCNYFSYLKCDLDMKVCQCKPGLIFQDGKCKAKIGHPCGSDYDGVFEFDPLKDHKRFSQAYSPLCVTDASCHSKPLFFIKQCWCDAGKTCDNGPNGTDPSPPATLLSDANSKFTLNLGEDCDPESQAILINPPEAEKADFKLRVENLEKLFKKPEVKFCDVSKYYNCTETLKKCECWENMIEENGECRVGNLDSCGDNFVYGGEFYPDGSKMWKVEEVFQKKFVPQCIKNAKCGSDEIPGKCICKNGNAGQICNDHKSVFASVLNPSNVNGYNKDAEINKVFYKLNYYMYKIEELMTLKYNDKCDPGLGVMLSRIHKFFKLVGSSDENMAGSKTLHQYSKTSKWAKFLLRTGVTELCNAFLGLECHKTTEKCRCPKGYVYEDKICKLNVNEQCDEKPVATWIPPCRNNSECQPSLSNFKFACTCIDGFAGETCSDKPGSSNNTDDANANANSDIDNLCYSKISSTPVKCDDPNSNGTKIDPNDSSGSGGNDQGGTGGDHNKSHADDPDHFAEIDEMLNEIMDHRNLALDKGCERTNENLLTKMFPHLPRFDRIHYGHLPLGVKESHSKLRWIFNLGINFCDRRKYYVCNQHSKCQCDQKHGLIRDGKNGCRLREHSFCGEIGTVFDTSQPIPVCQSGTKCQKLNFGIHKCIKVTQKF